MLSLARACGVLLVAVLVAVGCAIDSEPDVASQERRDRDGVDPVRVGEAIADSPQDWLAVVQEVVDDSECYGPKDGSSCHVLVRVVEFIGGSVERPVGWEYWNVEMRMPDAWPNRSIGRRRLVVSIPANDATDVYGNRVFLVDPSESDTEDLRRLLEEAEGAV